MASLKGLAVGVGAVIIVGYLALKTGAARGISDVAESVTSAVAAPFAGIGKGLSTLAIGVSDVFSPTIAPTIAPKFDWSGWMPFGNGAETPARQEDRNGNGNGIPTIKISNGGNGPILSGPAPNGVFKPPTTPQLPGYTPRPEDRRPIML